MIEPLPPLNKVFSLVVQEERQQSINHISSTSLAFLAVVSSCYLVTFFASKLRKDLPMCTHCNVLGHTIERCYKIHGCPPGYKSKFNSRPNTVQTNQISFNQNASSFLLEYFTPSTQSTLTLAQFQQLIALLSSQVSHSSSTSLGEQQPLEPSISLVPFPFLPHQNPFILLLGFQIQGQLVMFVLLVPCLSHIKYVPPSLLHFPLALVYQFLVQVVFVFVRIYCLKMFYTFQVFYLIFFSLVL